METHPPHHYARPIPDANPNTLRRRRTGYGNRRSPPAAGIQPPELPIAQTRAARPQPGRGHRWCLLL